MDKEVTPATPARLAERQFHPQARTLAEWNNSLAETISVEAAVALFQTWQAEMAAFETAVDEARVVSLEWYDQLIILRRRILLSMLSIIATEIDEDASHWR